MLTYINSWQFGNRAAFDVDLQATDELREYGFQEPVVDTVAAHIGQWDLRRCNSTGRQPATGRGR